VAAWHSRWKGIFTLLFKIFTLLAALPYQGKSLSSLLKAIHTLWDGLPSLLSALSGLLTEISTQWAASTGLGAYKTKGLRH